jgi:hypothetical protein
LIDILLTILADLWRCGRSCDFNEDEITRSREGQIIFKVFDGFLEGLPRLDDVAVGIDVRIF